MPPSQTAARWRLILLVVAVIVVAGSMRPAITAVGPILDQISEATTLPLGVLGLLTSVPLVTWALVSPFAHDLSYRWGLSRVLVGALVLLGIGALVRAVPESVIGLWVGTTIIGVAIAIGNVLMPAAVKRDFPTRVPLMMGIYSAVLGATGAAASGFIVPLAASMEGQWSFALVLISAAGLPLAIVLWACATRGDAPVRLSTDSPLPRMAMWRDKTAWTVAAYMGFQATSFYVFVTWLSPMAMSAGRSPEGAGVDVALFQVFGIAGSLGLPFLLRGGFERFAPATLPVLGVAGAAGLLLAPHLLTAWVAVLGLFCGASLSMALTLIAQRARTTDHASALSGMAQAVGYLITAVGPALFGALHAATGSWTVPLALAIGAMFVQGFVGIFAGRPGFVLAKH